MEGDQDVLYVIGTKEHLFTPNTVGDFKVGKSTIRSLEQRFRSIQTGNPNPLTIYVKIPFNNKRMENICHKELKKNKHRGIVKKRGEWFHGDLKVILDIIHRAVSMYDIRKELISKCVR